MPSPSNAATANKFVAKQEKAIASFRKLGTVTPGVKLEQPPAKKPSLVQPAELHKISPNISPPKKRSPLNFSKPNPEFVTFYISESKTLFKIHLDAINLYSPHFRNIFSNVKLEEGETKSMQLPEVDENVFSLFNNWLYNQDIERWNESNEIVSPTLMELAKLWTNAATWQIPSLQNQAMMLMIPMLMSISEKQLVSNDNILDQLLKYAYECKGDTQLKKLAVTKMVDLAPKLTNIKERAKKFPEGMIFDFLDVLGKRFIELPEAQRKLSPRVSEFLVPDGETKVQTSRIGQAHISLGPASS